MRFFCLANIDISPHYVFDPALFYLKGGAAFTRADYFKTAPIPSPLDERGGGPRAGWTAGVGMDYALWNNWSVRLEYDYLDFGSRAFAMNNAGTFAENVTVRLKAHEVKLGLNYLFNAGNLNPVVPPAPQSNKNEPDPQRLGLPAPLDSPPFPSGKQSDRRLVQQAASHHHADPALAGR